MKDIEMSKNKQLNLLKKKEEKRSLSEHNLIDPVVKRNNKIILPQIDSNFKLFKVNEIEKNVKDEMKKENKSERTEI